MFSTLLALIIFVSFLLIITVLVQKPKKGGGISALSGGAQDASPVKTENTFLDRLTWVFASILLVLILLAGFMAKRTGSLPVAVALEEKNLTDPQVDQEAKKVPSQKVSEDGTSAPQQSVDPMSATPVVPDTDE